MFLRKVFFIAILTWFALTVLGYGVYKAMPIMLGPSIELISPQDGAVVKNGSVDVRGEVLRTKALHINGIQTAFNESGVFFTRLPVYPGSNLILVTAEDKFGRMVSKTVNIGSN